MGINNLDTNYGATNEEKNYIKKTLDKKSVKELFLQEQNNLQSKIIKNFHNDNYLNFEINKMFDTEKQAMKNIINLNPTIKTKYEKAITAKNIGSSEGIRLLQAIAITCVEKINGKESVQSKLTSWNGIGSKSQTLDGIMGPNTFYVLASIAKEKNIPFNGIVDKPLLDAMINICETTTQTITTDKQLTQAEPVKITDTPEKNTQQDITRETPKIIANKPAEIKTPEKEISNTEDEVFTKIEETIKENTSAYPQRATLSDTEKNTTKNTYNEILKTQSIEKAGESIKKIDKKLLPGLGEIIVKKILIEKEKTPKSDTIEYLQEVGKIIIKTREPIQQEDITL